MLKRMLILILLNFRVQMKFENLFNGNKVIGEAINQLIEENSLLMWKELSPSALKAIEKIFLNIINDSIGRYAYEDIYLP